MQETIDGTIITELCTDQAGNTWHIMQRQEGSVCLYATRPGVGAHFVHYDSMDGWKPTRAALALFEQLPGVAAAINALLASVPQERIDHNA